MLSNYFGYVKKMSAGNISLNSSIRSCRIDTGWADRIASDRFLNPNLVVAPSWTGFDAAGRPAHQDSYFTKTAGGNSPLDRVVVENIMRPSYVEYVNLSQGGIEGAIYGHNKEDVVRSRQTLNNIYNTTGNFNNDYNATVRPNCGVYSYQRAMNENFAENSMINRNNQAGGISTAAAAYKSISGAY